jgi:hypothetical protein
MGIRRVRWPETQGVHHGGRAGAHRQDVPDDPADSGRGALQRLHERGVVVRLDLEGDRVAAANVHHTRVGADAG